MDRQRTQTLLEALAKHSDLRQILAETGLTEDQAHQLLMHSTGRSLRNTHRRMARVHAQILAQRWLPKAVETLSTILTSAEKVELQLRGAQLLLAVAGLDKPAAGKSRYKRKPVKRLSAADRARADNVEEKLAQLLEDERKREAMGRAPSPEAQPSSADPSEPQNSESK